MGYVSIHFDVPGFAICCEHSTLQLKRVSRPGTHCYDSILGVHCWKRRSMIENQSRILLFNIVLLSLLTVSVPALQQTKTYKNCWAALTNIKFLQKYLKLYFFYNKVIITKLLAHVYDHVHTKRSLEVAQFRFVNISLKSKQCWLAWVFLQVQISQSRSLPVLQIPE